MPSACCWPRQRAGGGWRLCWTAAERAAIDALMDDLRRTAADSADAAAIEAATEALAKGTEAFAARRMNHGIRQALAGRKRRRRL